MKRKPRQSTLAAIRSGFVPPAADLYLGSAIHISDRGAVQIENCKGISLYDENEIEVDLGSCRVRLSGDGLVLITLTPGTIAVEGRLFRVEFFY